MSTVAANELNEKFGFESIFDTTSSSGKFYDKNLNFTKLLEKFKRLKYTSFHYRLGDFISGTTSVNEYVDSRGDKFYGKSYGNIKDGLVVIRRLKVDVEIELNKLFKYSIKIPYAYPDSDEFDDRYAIIIDFEDYSSLELALNSLTYPDKELVNVEIQDYFDEFFEIDKSIDELKWIYKYAPDFVLEKRGDFDLIEDIKRFVSYDIDGFIGDWFRDASSPIMRALSSFTDLKNAYDYFNENPEDAIRTYSGLGDSERGIFTALLSVLSRIYGHNLRDSKFLIGGGYKLDSNLGQDSGKTFYLRQLKETPNTSVSTPVGRVYSRGLDEELSKDFFHPLDRVTLKDSITGE